MSPGGARGLSPEEGLAEFSGLAVRRLREELRPWLERAARGEGHEIDFDDLKRRVRKRLLRAAVPK